MNTRLIRVSRVRRVVMSSADAFISVPRNQHSKLKSDVREKRVEYAAGVNVFQPLARDKGGGAGRDSDVFGERRTVAHANAGIEPDAVANGRLKKNLLEGFGAFKAQIIYIGEPAQLGGDIEIGADVGQKNPRIH